MTTPLNSVLPGQQILHSNSLATVTEHCVIVRDFGQKSHTIVPLTSISNVTTVKTSQMPLMVFAAGAFIVAAAAHCSKQGCGAGIPCALIGLALLVAYILSHRASVILEIDSGPASSAFGTLFEAARVTKAIRLARKGHPIAANEDDSRSRVPAFQFWKSKKSRLDSIIVLGIQKKSPIPR